jgi:hypothetical protein
MIAASPAVDSHVKRKVSFFVKSRFISPYR